MSFPFFHWTIRPGFSYPVEMWLGFCFFLGGLSSGRTRSAFGNSCRVLVEDLNILVGGSVDPLLFLIQYYVFPLLVIAMEN